MLKNITLYQIWINRLLIRRRSPLSLILEKELVAFRSGTGIRKDPTLAAVLSIIGPALGPLYNGEFWKKAPAMIIALGIGYGVLYLAIEDNIEVYDTYVDVDNDDTIAVVGVAFILTTHILAPIDAYKSAKRINEENRKKVSFAPMIRPKSIGAKFSLVF